MRVLISGATGLVGRELTRELLTRGHEVTALSRTPRRPGEAGSSPVIVWNPKVGKLPAEELEGYEAVVHLAGEPILGRWTEHKKDRILESRVAGTELLARTLAGLKSPPQVLVTASAIGIYGDTGDSEVDEQGAQPAPVEDFLADVARAWEQASAAASAAGIRTVHARFGIILSRFGGALEAMILPFRLGLGGPVGSGRQWMSWVSNRDVARALAFLVENASCQGAYNISAPEPVTNRDFSKALGRALSRPAFLPVPALAVKLLYGAECAEATILRSARVRPQRLVEAGFKFEDTTVEEGLNWALNIRKAPDG